MWSSNKVHGDCQVSYRTLHDSRAVLEFSPFFIRRDDDASKPPPRSAPPNLGNPPPDVPSFVGNFVHLIGSMSIIGNTYQFEVTNPTRAVCVGYRGCAH
ncbi:hypothetical protein V496_02461 [Pseudogymnoascus sp. VKM F-4515 (FW-2607)]|nr:hypothetical protein V496_02461 [Pseudogymnoascus sp. VKM F-4515 (FW-2607)]